MIKIKHVFEAVEADDGQRIWVEPIGLTRDLRDWCKVDEVFCHLGPPEQLWAWFNEHPDGWEFYRGRYHECLAGGPHHDALQRLACASLADNVTLIHSGADAAHNTASALHEFLSELEAYCPREEPPSKRKPGAKTE